MNLTESRVNIILDPLSLEILTVEFLRDYRGLVTATSFAHHSMSIAIAKNDLSCNVFIKIDVTVFYRNQI